jgi:protein gp37
MEGRSPTLVPPRGAAQATFQAKADDEEHHRRRNGLRGGAVFNWWDITFDIYGGCEGPVSPGCLNCVSAKLAATRQHDRLHSGVTVRFTDRRGNDFYFFNDKRREVSPGDPRWNQLLTYKGADHPLLGDGQPSLIWIGSMSDVFSQGHRLALLDRALATVCLTRHIGLVLTKFPDRMAAYFSTRARPRWQQHIWCGTSCENQTWFDRRWPHMRPLADAGWTVFVSLAPLLGPITLPADLLALRDRVWVIVNGEEKVPHKICRDMNPNWARDIRDQCAPAGVPLFVRGMSHNRPTPPDLLLIRQFPAVRVLDDQTNTHAVKLNHRLPSSS